MASLIRGDLLAATMRTGVCFPHVRLVTSGISNSIGIPSQEYVLIVLVLNKKDRQKYSQGETGACAPLSSRAKTSIWKRRWEMESKNFTLCRGF